ncbi:hypothetical protein C8R46DRAFT_1345158, partial [Mycena filopes]
MTSKLSRHLRCLGIPTPSLDSTSSTRTSGEDFEVFGWRFSDIPADELWLPSFTGLPAATFTTRHSKSKSWLILGQIQQNRELFMLTFGSESCIMKVADDYRLGSNFDSPPGGSETHLLKVCLHFAAAEFALRRPLLEFANSDGKLDLLSSSHEQHDSETLTAMVTPDLLGPDATVKARKSKEASLLTLLRLNGGQSVARDVQELTMTGFIESILDGIFYNSTRIHTVDGPKLYAPEILRPTQSPVFPGIDALTCAYLEPIVFVGNTVGRDEGQTDLSDTAVLAQMAAAGHPALTFLVLAHHRRDRDLNILAFPTEMDTEKLPSFDQQSMVYGIYSNEKHVRIYVHFPQIEEQNGRFVTRFYQLEVACFTLASKFVQRWRLAVALLHIRKHADMISRVFTAFT